MIPFTQFLLPDGRRKTIEVDRPSTIEEAAHKLIAQGYVFEIEMLRTGAISMEILKHIDDDDPDVLAGELCINGPSTADVLGVPEAVDKMVKDATAELQGRVKA